jgi:hypothetical protein
VLCLHDGGGHCFYSHSIVSGTRKHLKKSSFVSTRANFAAGKIYVINENTHVLTTYTNDGKRTTPTINSFNSTPRGVALDAGGRLYVAVGQKLGIYSLSGSLINMFADVPGSTLGIAVN